MLLEAPNSDTSRTMAPVLEAAFPTGSKSNPDKMKEADRRLVSDVAMLHRHTVSSPWRKVVIPDALTSKSRMGGPPVSMPGVVRCLPERPEPVYPPSYKMSQLQPPSPDSSHLNPGSHIQKPDFRMSKRPLMPRSHQLQLPVPRSEMTPSSSPGGMSSNTASPATYFRPGFNPVAGYPPGAPPYMGMPHRPPHPHTASQGHFPGGTVSAAGFMSLAHILFQPKYPIGKKTFQCHQCRYITDRKNNLKRHIATMHQDCGKFLECCDIIFRSKAALRDHVLLYHRTGYKCRFCGRNFCRKALLKRHLAVHNGQKEYICEVCDYATSHKSNLERHRKVHGLGSPLGSEDGDQFLQDGPDSEGYDPHFQALQDPPTDHLDVSMSDEERDINVESSGVDEDDTVDEDKEVSLNHYHFGAEKQYTESTRCADPEVSQMDPLLQAFPINLVVHKKSLNGKKHKSKLYFSDRLRQTYESEDNIREGEADSAKSKSYIHQIQKAHLRNDNSSEDIPKDFSQEKSVKGDSVEVKPNLESSGPEYGRDDTQKPPTPPRPTVPRDSPSSSKKPTKTTSIPDEVSAENLTSRIPTGVTGCRRLYASPYKCSECGLGLPSQHLLLQHSLLCRKVGVEPPRPIQSLAPGEGDCTGRRGAEEAPGRAGSDHRPGDNLTGKLMNLSRKRYAHETDTCVMMRPQGSDLSMEVPLNYKIPKSMDDQGYEYCNRLGVDELPRDFSVRNLLGFSRKPETGDIKERLGAAEDVQSKELLLSFEEQGRSLPIKKRSLNHLGK